MKRILSLLLVLVIALANLSVSYAEEKTVLTDDFVKEAELSIVKDDKGEPVVLLTNVEELSTRSRSGERNYSKTVVAILAENDKKAAEIIKGLQGIQRGSGTLTEEDWFFGDSVYLSSTLYYTTVPIDDTIFSAAGLDKVTIRCTTNSGTTVSKMTLTMYQKGPSLPDGYMVEYKKDFNATTTRSFNAPSSWLRVDTTSSSTTISATLECTAVRPDGTSSTFRFANHFIV